MFIDLNSIKKVIIVGLGYRTGLAAANFLSSRGFEVTVSDNKDEMQLAEIISQLANSVKVLTKHQDPKILDEGYDMLVLSPGVPKAIPLVQHAIEKNIPVVSEIELASYYLKGTIIAITGTDGKSTTTSLTAHILKQLGVKTLMGGNIGIPLISLVDSSDENTVSVVEVSSYQLETIHSFRPDVAAILNISSDHLYRYPSMKEYFETKMRITSNQTKDDFFVYNADDETISSAISRVNAAKLSFSLKDENTDCFFNGEMIVNKNQSIDPSKMKIMGVHNIQNEMAAFLIVKAALSKMKSEKNIVNEAFYSFVGLPHRMEYIGDFAGRKFVNDSKATTVGAVGMALKSFNGSCILIVGGRTMGDDYSKLAQYAKGRVRGVVIIGESSSYFADIFSDFKYLIADTLEDAVLKSLSLSLEGDTVLLSPACASFDMFESFEQRGDVFRSVYFKLVNGELKWI